MRALLSFMFSGCAAALACTAATSGATSAGEPSALSAAALYDAAADRWKALPKSAFATYVTHVEVTRKNRVTKRVERIAYRRADNVCLTVGVPLDGRDRPDSPSVTDRCLAPDYSFTFVPQQTPGHGGPLPLVMSTPLPVTEGPATIGHVVVRARPYDVAYAGSETINGISVTHLSLRPFGDPAKHVLRDLWIAPDTDAVVRLHGVAPLLAAVATVDFVADYDVGPDSQRLSSVSGFAKAQLFLVKVGADFTFAQTNYAFPSSLPFWYFEKNGYASHLRSLASPGPAGASS